jgi:hypothetical protein
VESVTGVRAQPGGRVTLHFDQAGYRVVRQPGRLDLLLGDAGCVISLVLALLFGTGAGFAASRGYLALAIVLGVLALPWTLVVLARLFIAILAEVAGYALLALWVILLPLLAFPGVRRWLRARRAARSAGPGPAAHGYVPADSVTTARIQHEADLVTVLVQRGDDAVRYQAAAGPGRQLEHHFRTVLGTRLITYH